MSYLDVSTDKTNTHYKTMNIEIQCMEFSLLITSKPYSKNKNKYQQPRKQNLKVSERKFENIKNMLT